MLPRVGQSNVYAQLHEEVFYSVGLRHSLVWDLLSIRVAQGGIRVSRATLTCPSGFILESSELTPNRERACAPRLRRFDRLQPISSLCPQGISPGEIVCFPAADNSVDSASG